MLTQEEFCTQLLPIIEKEGKVYKKIQNVYARPARRGEHIITITKDGIETMNVAGEGDFVVKNQTDAKETYIISEKKLNDRYEYLSPQSDDFAEYSAKGKIIAVEMDDSMIERINLGSSFQFMAAWGHPMVVKPGDFLASPPALNEVYRLARKEFFETYQLVEEVS